MKTINTLNPSYISHVGGGCKCICLGQENDEHPMYKGSFWSFMGDLDCAHYCFEAKYPKYKCWGPLIKNAFDPRSVYGDRVKV